MTGQMLAFAGLVLALILVIIVLLVQRRQLERLREQLGRQPQREKPNFHQSLAQAEKQPRESRAPLPLPRSSGLQTDLADRYRCISAMARQGLDAGQISVILQISEAEARQVIRLAEVRQNGNDSAS